MKNLIKKKHCFSKEEKSIETEKRKEEKNEDKHLPVNAGRRSIEQGAESACGSSQGTVAFIRASLTEGGLQYPLRGQWRETLKAV